MEHTNSFSALLEAVLLAAGRPLSEDQLLHLFAEDQRPSLVELREALKNLEEACADRGIELLKVASGYRFQVKSQWMPWVRPLFEEKPPKYSRALLETLALIAYKQPITRGEIEDVRGVAVNANIIKTLEEREWIKMVGHKEVPGRPALYATTKSFLDYFGLKHLNELPSLPALMEQITVVEEQNNETIETLTPLADNESIEATKPSESLEQTL